VPAAGLTLALAILAGAGGIASGEPAPVDADQIVEPKDAAAPPAQISPKATPVDEPRGPSPTDIPPGRRACPSPVRPSGDDCALPAAGPVNPDTSASRLVDTIVNGGTGTVVTIPPKGPEAALDEHGALAA
jgi:hypothetical protein